MFTPPKNAANNDPPPSSKSSRKRPLSAAAERMRKKRKIHKPTECTGEPQIISSEEEDNGFKDNQDGSWKRIHGITLTKNDRNVILNGGWLNDKIINAAQLLMKHDRDLQPIGSLQDPLLGENLQYSVAGDESVQILHSGGAHWVTISTVGMRHPTVKVYDSLYKSLPWSTKEQIAALLQTKESAITLEYGNVQVRYSDI